MRVYKFLNAKYGLEALEKRRLKIARINGLNDPLELLGTNLSNQELRGEFVKMKNSLNKNRGLLCFSNLWTNHLLWSHYYDRRRGLFLGFYTPDHIIFHVNYTAKRAKCDKLFVVDQLEKESEMKKLLSTKFSHWRYENEVRCFVSLENKDPDSEKYFYSFSDDMKIQQVLVGAEADVSRHDVKKALGAENAHAERIKTRAEFQTFNVVRNQNLSLWRELVLINGARNPACNSVCERLGATISHVEKQKVRTPCVLGRDSHANAIWSMATAREDGVRS